MPKSLFFQARNIRWLLYTAALHINNDLVGEFGVELSKEFKLSDASENGNFQRWRVWHVPA